MQMPMMVSMIMSRMALKLRNDDIDDDGNVGDDDGECDDDGNRWSLYELHDRWVGGHYIDYYHMINIIIIT